MAKEKGTLTGLLVRGALAIAFLAFLASPIGMKAIQWIASEVILRPLMHGQISPVDHSKFESMQSEQSTQEQEDHERCSKFREVIFNAENLPKPDGFSNEATLNAYAVAAKYGCVKLR